MYSTLAFIGLYIDVGDRALISIGHNMGTGSSREVETPRRLSLTNSPLTRKPRYDYTRPSNNQNGRPSMQRPIWTPNPSPPPRQPRYYLFNLAVLGLFQGHIWGGSLQCLAHFRRSNSQIGNWDQQQGSNGQRSPSIGRRSESEWSDHRRASLQHQDSLESRRSEAEASPKNVAAANKVAADNSEDELLQIKRRQWEESTAKRIHVVVRARPLNIREIKNDARVYIILHPMFNL